MASPSLSTNNEQSESIGLLDQYKLLLSATRDSRLSRGDLATLAEIIERHMKSYGNSRASYTHIANAVGLSRRSAINSSRHLKDLGYIEVGRLGAGTRATEYVPAWGKNFASSEPDCTTSSGAMGFTTVVNSIAPLEPLVVNPIAPHNSFLPDHADKACVQVKKESDSPVAAPPSAPALEAGPTGATGFEELWNAYGVRTKRKEAKSAYEALAPYYDFHNEIVEAAEGWRAAYVANGTERKWQKNLHNWITDECYREDPPEGWGASAKPSGKEIKPTISEYTVTEVEIEFEEWMSVHMEDVRGNEIKDMMTFDGPDSQFAALLNILGVSETLDCETDLVGHKIFASTDSDGVIHYHPR